jgi:hypothetical protein
VVQWLQFSPGMRGRCHLQHLQETIGLDLDKMHYVLVTVVARVGGIL